MTEKAPKIEHFFYRRKTVAKMFDVHVRTIDRYSRDGLLPPARELSPGVKGWTPADIQPLLDKLNGVAR